MSFLVHLHDTPLCTPHSPLSPTASVPSWTLPNVWRNLSVPSTGFSVWRLALHCPISPPEGRRAHELIFTTPHPSNPCVVILSKVPPCSTRQYPYRSISLHPQKSFRSDSFQPNSGKGWERLGERHVRYRAGITRLHARKRPFFFSFFYFLVDYSVLGCDCCLVLRYHLSLFLLHLDPLPVIFHVLSFHNNQTLLNTLRTGLWNCLNARSRGLTFRHRASCI